MKGLFPEVFTDNKVDVEKLAEIFGYFAEEKDEKFDFTWNVGNPTTYE